MASIRLSSTFVCVACALVLAACSSTPVRESRPSPAAPSGKSGYYKDDGPADSVPADLDAVPDAVPKREPLNRFANRPYTVFGREYVPATSLRPYRERGVASWYGRKFHGQKTSTGETYDMFSMTAAHPTLPLPSFAKVTNPANGRSVIVRVNDRGPFLNDRVIDLSFAAAHRLGIAQKGSGEVEVEALLLDDPIAVAAPALPPVATRPTVMTATIGAAAPAMVAAASASATPATSTAASGPAANAIAAADRPSAAPVITAALATPPSVSAQPLASEASSGVLGIANAAPSTTAPLSDTIPVAPARGGFVVQLGAFASNPNAQAFAARIANQLPAVGVEAQVRQVNGLFRVFVGPYAARDDARRVAELIGSALGLPTTIALH